LYKRNESSIWSFDYNSTVANFSACADAKCWPNLPFMISPLSLEV
jgi:hypothetical protein